MNKLKKFLFSCLICSVFFFTLIPKTYADTGVTVGLSGEVRTIDDTLISTFDNSSYIYVGENQFPVFKQLTIPFYFSKNCDVSYVYRIDYTIWGWHNESKTKKDWMRYSRLISISSPDKEVLGTIIEVVNGYELNFTTFVKWTPIFCPVDTINDLELIITDYARDGYFWNWEHATNRNYSTLNGIYGEINENLALELLAQYYGGNDVEEKLDELKGEVIYVNQKLDDLNDNLNNVNSSIKDTQDYLKDDTAPSADINVLGNVQGILPEGPIDSLLNIPFKVLSILNSSFGGVCVPISGKFVFDSTLTIPCFSELFYNNVPDGIMVFINVVPSAFILIAYLKNLYKRVDRALSLETSADDEWGGI